MHAGVAGVAGVLQDDSYWFLNCHSVTSETTHVTETTKHSFIGAHEDK